MKNISLGTSALAGIATGTRAFAQATPWGEPIKLRLFGHFRGPVHVGGAYEYARDTSEVPIGDQQRENSTFDLGAICEIGPFDVGLDWTKGYKPGLVNSATRTLDWISLSTDCKLGPWDQCRCCPQLHLLSIARGPDGRGRQQHLQLLRHRHRRRDRPLLLSAIEPREPERETCRSLGSRATAQVHIGGGRARAL